MPICPRMRSFSWQQRRRSFVPPGTRLVAVMSTAPLILTPTLTERFQAEAAWLTLRGGVVSAAALMHAGTEHLVQQQAEEHSPCSNSYHLCSIHGPAELSVVMRPEDEAVALREAADAAWGGFRDKVWHCALAIALPLCDEVPHCPLALP